MYDTDPASVRSTTIGGGMRNASTQKNLNLTASPHGRNFLDPSQKTIENPAVND